MKLVSFNISIKKDNTKSVISFLEQIQPDIIALQESMMPREESVVCQHRSAVDIENHFKYSHQHSFFAPIYIADGITENGEYISGSHGKFGGMAEQGTQLLSKHPIILAENLFYYNQYSRGFDATHFREKDLSRSILSAIVELPNKKCIKIINVHGIWNADRMGDERTIQQSEFIAKKFLKDRIPTIIAGDFNLFPESKSMKMFDQFLINLPVKYGIKTTRPQFDDGLDRGNMVVDYILVSDDIKTNDFKVMENSVSDHYPLLVDFDV
jgi:endonuclease/exonuclease/phosphatase family metal-dependent hydrolase